MKRLALVLLVAGAATTGAPPADAGHVGTKKCGVISRGAADYRVRAIAMKCDPAERGAKRFLRAGTALAGFTCSEAEGATPFLCKRDQQAYWAVLL